MSSSDTLYTDIKNEISNLISLTTDIRFDGCIKKPCFLDDMQEIIFKSVETCESKCIFTPETLVYGDYGVKRIEDIKEGDNVLTMNSMFGRVKNVYKIKIAKEILKISTFYSFDDILVTKNNKIYAFNEEEGIPCYVNVVDLTPLHNLCFPLNRTKKENDENMEGYYKFYGIIYANGNIYEEDDTILIIFEEYKNVMQYLEDFLMKEKIKYIITSNTYNIKLSDIKKEKLINIYDENGYKYIHSNLFNVSKKDIKEFLSGVFESSDKFFVTENRMLAYQLSFLSLKSDKPRMCIKENILYKIECISNDNLYEMYEHEEDVEFNSLFEYKIWFNIKDIERYYYEGELFGLDIEENDNYTTNLGLVHSS